LLVRLSSCLDTGEALELEIIVLVELVGAGVEVGLAVVEVGLVSLLTVATVTLIAGAGVVDIVAAIVVLGAGVVVVVV